MAVTLQTFLARAIEKAHTDMIAALDNLPAEKRAWSAMGDARTALNQIAECAILNGSTADMVKAKAWTMGDDFGAYMTQKAALANDEAKCRALLAENTARAVTAIKEVADEDLEISIDTPFGEAITLAQACAYPYWNMCYHEGQINYIASLLGLLK